MERDQDGQDEAGTEYEAPQAEDVSTVAQPSVTAAGGSPGPPK